MVSSVASRRLFGAAVVSCSRIEMGNRFVIHMWNRSGAFLQSPISHQ
jgi:hypothetical protein